MSKMASNAKGTVAMTTSREQHGGIHDHLTDGATQEIIKPWKEIQSLPRPILRTFTHGTWVHCRKGTEGRRRRRREERWRIKDGVGDEGNDFAPFVFIPAERRNATMDYYYVSTSGEEDMGLR